MIHLICMSEVSVIVPTFNAKKFIQETWDSLQAQTHKSFTVIFIDDCSNDGTQDYLKSLEAPNIKLVLREQNSGSPAASMHDGIAVAETELIAFLDHDDVAEPTWLEDLSQRFKDNSALQLAWGRHATISNESVQSVAFRNPWGSEPQKIIPTFLRWTPGTSGMMVRREAFDRVGNFDPEMLAIADHDWTIRWAWATQDGDVSISDKVLIRYRTHAGNLSGSVRPARLVEMKRFVEKHAEKLSSVPEIHAWYMYRVAWLCEALGFDHESDQYLARAISIFPTKKYYAYRYLKKFGLINYVRPITNLRGKLDDWRRKWRHRLT